MNDHCRYHKQGRVQDSQKGEDDDVVGGGGFQQHDFAKFSIKITWNEEHFSVFNKPFKLLKGIKQEDIGQTLNSKIVSWLSLIFCPHMRTDMIWLTPDLFNKAVRSFVPILQ